MNRIKYYRDAWDVVAVLLAIIVAAIAILWAGEAAGEEPVPDEPPVEMIVSPWDGVFRSSDPATGLPFVEVGDHVTPETIVGMIDLDIMQPERKIPVFAGVSGTVVQVVAEDGSFVAAGQTLIVVRLDPPNT